MMRPLIASLLTAAAVLLSTGAAGAHTTAAAPTPPTAATPRHTTAAAPAPTSQYAAAPNPHGASTAATALPLLAAGVAMVALGGSPRRLALALVVVSAIVGVDAAVHSVHHLSDPGGAASCALASGSMHAPAVLTAATVDAVAPGPVAERDGDAATPSLDRHARRPDRGRAPPSSSAA